MGKYLCSNCFQTDINEWPSVTCSPTERENEDFGSAKSEGSVFNLIFNINCYNIRIKKENKEYIYSPSQKNAQMHQNPKQTKQFKIHVKISH